MLTETLYPTFNISYDRTDAPGDSVDEIWTTIAGSPGNNRRGAGGNDVSFSVTAVASTTSNQFKELGRGFFTFDLSSLNGALISSVSLFLYGRSKSNGLGSPSLNITDAFSVANYQSKLNTTLGSIAYGSYSTTGYNEIVFNTNGINYIDEKKGNEVYMSSRLSWDVLNSFGGSWASLAGTFFAYWGLNEDQSGDRRPYLYVEYTRPVSQSIIVG